MSEVQQLKVAATGGTFQLERRENLLKSGLTPALPFNISAAGLQSALEGLYGIGTVQVSGGPGDPTGNHPYSIAFKGTLADQPINPLVSVRGGLTGSKEAEVTRTIAGRPDGQIVLRATNLGDAPVAGKGAPVSLVAQLPPGLHAVGISANAPQFGGGSEIEGVPCSLGSLTCTFKAELAPFSQIEVRIDVTAAQVVSGADEVGFNVSGGGASQAETSWPLAVADQAGEPTPFGLQVNELGLEEPDGSTASRAGSHPFQVTSSLALDQTGDAGSLGEAPKVDVGALPKDLNVKLPPGLVGNTRALKRCSLLNFLTFAEVGRGGGDFCDASTAIGVASVNLNEPTTTGYLTLTVPVFNVEPSFGEPARFGFYIPIAHQPVLLDTSVRSGAGEDYGINVSSLNTTQTAGLISTTVTLWGTPGDPRHDNARGWGCLSVSRGETDGFPCFPANQVDPPAFQTLPTGCSGTPSAEIALNSWLAPNILVHDLVTPSLPALTGCNQLPFSPTIDAEPTSDAAASATGLSFDLEFHDEGLLNLGGLAQSQVKKAVVTLPEGFTANPSLVEGLKACPQSAFEAATTEIGTGCPEESKIGDVEIESPLVAQKLNGGLYVAKQKENPYGNLLTIYLVARNPELGFVVKQALKVTPNPLTGQLVTEVDNIPQLPFSRFHLSFRSGQRAPLITPSACGTYAVGAALYPYSEPGTPLQRESGFQITQGPEGQSCPSGGVPPFHPGLEAGTVNNAAGTYSPFVTHITRKDSEQEITRFSIKPPPGVIGKLAGVSSCSDAGIAAAKAREKEGGGSEEQANSSCPANSEVGHSLVGSGVGNVLAYAPGKLYLAGPYHGSPISIVSITAAKVGPFDLGTVVVRFALNIDHETAEVSVDGANSDPIPHIVDGIPVHLRDIRAYVDRPDFTLNPTSCAKKSTASTILGSGLDFVSPLDDNPVTVSSPFQAADCASLGFKPALKLTLGGKKTHRGALPAFKAVLTYPKHGAYANIAKAQVTLPPSEILEQAHLEKVCPKSVFTTGSTPGENCPASSIYGTAKAWTPLLDEPLEGPVFLRTGYGTVLPELTATLNNKQIHIVLAGKIDSVQKKGTEISRIRNTFELVPDAPVSKFVLEMKGGSKGLLVNKTNICRGTHKAIAAFTAQNGKLHEFEPVLTASACAKKSKKAKK